MSQGWEDIKPTMAEAVAAGDGTLHGAIDYWQNKCATLEAENAELRRDAERYRWLRSQHEGHTPLEVDAEGFPIPQEPTPIAFTVFEPGQDCSLEPVSCMVGTLDATIDAAMKENGNG